MEKDLTKGNPFPVLLKFSIPVIGGNVFQLFYTLADTMIVGQTMGADALAAVGATSTVVCLILYFIQGLTSGFGIKLGQFFGAKNKMQMKRSVATSILLSILFTIFITIISCSLAHPIMGWIHTPNDIYQMAYDYMFVIMLGTGATVYYNLISNILRALGDSKTPLYFLILSSILNIILDYIFIVPFGWGVAGAAYATVLSQLVSAILCTLFALKKFDIMHLQSQDWKITKEDIFSHLRIGFPMGFQMSVMCIGLLAMQAAVNSIGTNAIAGYTAATKIDQISVLINNAFGIAISNYVAQNYGAGLVARIKKGVLDCFIMTTIANILIAGLMLLLQPWVVPLFVENPNPEIFMYAKDYLFVVVPFYILLGILITYRSAVQSIGITWGPFIACMIELVMRVSCALGLVYLWGYKGVCFATPMAWLGAVVFLLPVYFKNMRSLSTTVNLK